MYTVSIRPPGYNWTRKGFATYAEAIGFANRTLAERGAQERRHGRDITHHEDGMVIAVWVAQ